MKILIVHNQYQFKGGEDSVVFSEAELLQSHGHEVRFFYKDNKEIENQSKLALLKQTIWAKEVNQEVKQILTEFAADVIHVHNTFPLISPSIYWLAQELSIPVVQTLHNFRLLCPQAMFLRKGKVCEGCLAKNPWRSVIYGCYRGSRAQSMVLSAMLVIHRLIGTWSNKVDRYIALNNFCKNKFIEGGLPATKIVIKPNFIKSPDMKNCQQRDGFLFVGRLSQEKGIGVLAEAAKKLEDMRFYVAGIGPEEGKVVNISNLVLLGALSKEMVTKKMLATRALIVPSVWYENFPMTIVEAYASGLPVIASNIGALQEIIIDGETGLLFEAGSSYDLSQKIKWMEQNPDKALEMGKKARKYYENYLSEEKNYQMLMSIYNEAIQEKRSAG